MEDKDIIGKEFICCEFERMPMLQFDSKYKEVLGFKSQVGLTHEGHPEYTQVIITLQNGRKESKYFPTEVIKKQIEEMENRPIEQYFDNVRKILAKL
jgi:hypothetical protein